jgi:hypothetical protein
MRRVAFAFWLIMVTAGWNLAEAAGFDAAKIADLKRATEAFQALGKDAYETGNPPRQTDPAVKALLDVVFDTSALNGPPPITWAQFLDVNNWLADVVGVGGVYLTAGTGIADLSTATGFTADQQNRVNQNVITYAPEMGRYYDAQLSVSRAEIELIAAQLAAHPDDFKDGTKAQGIAKMRSGLTTQMTGVLSTFQLSGVDPEWLNDRLPVLHALALSAAKFLTADQKRQLHDLAAQLSGTMSDARVKSGLDAVAQALSP